MGYSPWGDAAVRLPHVHIELCPIAPVRGAWVPSERVILLDDALSRVELRSVLAHEIAHVDNADHDCPPRGPDRVRLARRRELAADTLAARRLITLDELADALAWARRAEEAAAELDVTVPILRRRLAALTPAEQLLLEQRIERIEGGAA
jgi:Zn-dependent peptidase ImmA (M78 family)